MPPPQLRLQQKQGQTRASQAGFWPGLPGVVHIFGRDRRTRLWDAGEGVSLRAFRATDEPSVFVPVFDARWRKWRRH